MNCKLCNKQISYILYDYFVVGKEIPQLCRECEPIEVGKCEVCGKTIEERGDVVRKRGYIAPRRHQACEIWKTCICNNCGDAFDITYGEKKYFEFKDYDIPCSCEECRKSKKISVPVGFCGICGKSIMQRGDYIRKYGMKKIEYHKECKNDFYQNRSCKICGDTFPITMGEKLFYEKKGLNLPWKCKDCR